MKAGRDRAAETASAAGDDGRAAGEIVLDHGSTASEWWGATGQTAGRRVDSRGERNYTMGSA